MSIGEYNGSAKFVSKLEKMMDVSLSKKSELHRQHHADCFAQLSLSQWNPFANKKLRIIEISLHGFRLEFIKK